MFVCECACVLLLFCSFFIFIVRWHAKCFLFVVHPAIVQKRRKCTKLLNFPFPCYAIFYVWRSKLVFAKNGGLFEVLCVWKEKMCLFSSLFTTNYSESHFGWNEKVGKGIHYFSALSAGGSIIHSHSFHFSFLQHLSHILRFSCASVWNTATVFFTHVSVVLLLNTEKSESVVIAKARNKKRSGLVKY